MAEDGTSPAPPAQPRLDKAARRAERARINRLSRLPFLYDLALRGPAGMILATLVQTVLAIVLGLAIAGMISGELLPAYVALIVLAVAFALQALARYLNAQAGRR